LTGSRTAEKIPLAGGFGDPLKGRASRRRLMMLMTKSGYTLRIALGRFAMMQETATIRGWGEAETSAMRAMHVLVSYMMYIPFYMQACGLLSERCRLVLDTFDEIINQINSLRRFLSMYPMSSV
jgi:hypothetical protein